MNASLLSRRAVLACAGAAVALVLYLGALAVPVAAQQPQPQEPSSPQDAAPVDYTGYWVSLITEDWRHRMVTPPLGDTDSLPVSREGQMMADAWDPAADEAASEQCKAYGAAGLMRMPIRVLISWEDDTTLKLETDNGQQTRLFHFDQSAAPAGAPGWQGHSVARWETMREAQGLPAGGGGRGGGGAPALSGGIEVVTTNMRPGYLRRNGVPYSAQTVMTEYFDAFSEPDGTTYLVISTTVEDPVYLNQPYITDTHFKKEPDGSKWMPRPCEITPIVEGTRR